ncbi:TetR family transcriptional regulator [Nocardia sp. alder85J]|uniref:TetR family transcriptional regulator n=1 Tax=Nocardia sp. alder85J TaxID=2862949 RepID=UPI001CD625FA|nr:TetR family transcriptional regulator [Nocardia sp. alder85J]MCX4095215.1 TetR family transcriptional regulator [Nocardia sp. alder85J]
MSRAAGRDPRDRIIEVVLTLLQTEGYDSVQLRRVARLSQASLATVYKLFPTRDELIVAAVAEWMATNAYPDLTAPAPEETVYEGLMRVLRNVFQPWERNPGMLEAFHRARSGPGGTRLDAQGFDAVIPVAGQIFGGADPEYVADVGLVLTNMIYALIARFTERTIEIGEILPTLERVIGRLTSNNEVAAAAALTRRPAPGQEEPFYLDPAVTAPLRRRADYRPGAAFSDPAGSHTDAG